LRVLDELSRLGMASNTNDVVWALETTICFESFDFAIDDRGTMIKASKPSVDDRGTMVKASKALDMCFGGHTR
jgi:hypothetical protein